MRLGRVTQTAPLQVLLNGDTVAAEAVGPALPVGAEVVVENVEGRRFVVHHHDDTGWTTMTTLLNDWTPYHLTFASHAPKYRRLDGVVYLQGLITGTAATADIFFTLPAGFRPAGNVMRAAQTNAGGNVRYDVLASGSCVIYRSQADASYGESYISIATEFPADG